MYGAFWISVEAENVVEVAVVFVGRYLTLLDQTALSQTLIYAYRKTPFISSHAKPVANITSEARHGSYMIEQKNTWPTTTRR